ncbi:HlyD family efflux transporter periplasmic adaptor subunit [bacterium]|nr:HlyD family efflux transporter periplasmic adaptor subunit [bacterium]
MKTSRLTIPAVALALILSGCNAPEVGVEDHSHSDGHNHEAASEAEQEGALPPGVVSIPQAVRDNLGLTFAKVERRVVQGAQRLPGRFEATPLATTEYRSASDGRISFLVGQYEEVVPGTPLYSIETEGWQEIQGRLAQAALAADLIVHQEAAAQGAVDAARSGVEIWRSRTERLKELRESGAGQAAQLAEAHSALSIAEGSLADALTRQKLLKYEALAVRDENGRNQRFQIALHQAATLIGCEEDWLLEEVDGKPRWQTIHTIDVSARKHGVVATINATDGGLVEPGELLLSTRDPNEVRFRAYALQADLDRLPIGNAVRIVPPHGASTSYTEAIDATLGFGTEADPIQRTIDLIAIPATGELPNWARPGVAAFVEIVTEGSDEPEMAIPLGAVVSDGLDRVFFLRDRNDPDRARRIVADLGATDGRWIIVNSGVRPGDEVVLDGVFELKLTTSGAEQKGGHFHSDGTFHAGED